MRETPRKGSGSWMACLPRRLSPSRQAIPGRWETAEEASRALAAAIADIDRGRAARPGVRGGQTRKMRHLVESYIATRAADPHAPIAARTLRDYTGALNNQVCHPKANLGQTAVSRVDTPALNQWMADLARAKVPRSRIQYARRVVSAALAWDVENGNLHINPAAAIRIRSTKASRAADQHADPVLVPTWKELAALTLSPQRWEDRVLIALMAWSGLRWSEAISLDISAVDLRRPMVNVERVLTQAKGQWVVEAVKAGLSGAVPVPEPLWEALCALSASRPAQKHPVAGRLVFRAPGGRRGGIGAIDNTNWSRHVWYTARAAAGLTGDPGLPTLDPRRRPIKIKDLRATTASVLVDAGATRLEAAALLRHADPRTTDKHYSRALADRHHDPARAAIRLDTSLSLPDRLTALFQAWVASDPENLSTGLLRPPGGMSGATVGATKIV